jgi:RNA polymerase sigma-70 factor (sigma-E family)
MSDTLQATPAAVQGEDSEVWADLDADRAVTKLYRLHYRSLVRLAAILVGDVATAEELVQDSFLAMYTSWRRLRDRNRALPYLRRSVVNRSRSVLRHRAVVNKIPPKLEPHMPAAEQEVIIRLDQHALVSALQALPIRQREVLVLRYYADLPESQIASALGISRGAVRSHVSRAKSSLRAELRSAVE